MAGGGGGGDESNTTLEQTPTWFVAIVCSVIVFISVLFERFLHRLGKGLQKNNRKPLFEALQKIKEELMLLGFISLLLVVLQGPIQRICIPESITRKLRHCKGNDAPSSVAGGSSSGGNHGGARRLLAGGGEVSGHCHSQGKVPLMSVEAIHELHIFIFVLAVTHVMSSLITMVLGIMQMRKWRSWEDSIHEAKGNVPPKIRDVQKCKFTVKCFEGFSKDSSILSWVHSFFKQFYGSVTKSDYNTMRHGFIMTHCRGNPGFDFYKYMIRVLEADYKQVVGISGYLWIFAVIFLLVGVEAWHVYFWISFVPLILLLAVGTKLEHVIAELVSQVAEGHLKATLSDKLFWFNNPRVVLFLIHFMLFQVAFEIAIFFWKLTTYGMESCIMEQVGYIVPRLIICVLVQILSSYSTLPLYAIVTQMGSSFNMAIFNENVRAGVLDWARCARNKKDRKMSGDGGESNMKESTDGNNKFDDGHQLERVVVKEDAALEG
ncbi:MLO-like protein 1 [Zingiber officinale]|uniref:MLO-like protein 1 n=1 Tax=Zingiber officinale TaxID=94328 RepID=UPI001C4A7934|nr:MLO-like protein 1 [Zingiber officinale]